MRIILLIIIQKKITNKEIIMAVVVSRIKLFVLEKNVPSMGREGIRK